MNRAPYGIAPVAPVVGMPATVCIGSDTYAARVTDVVPARGRRRQSVWIRMDHSPDVQSRFVPSRAQPGIWDDAGNTGRRAYLGAAHTYRDPTF